MTEFMPSPEYFVFTLYVSERSERTIVVYERLAKLCFQHLPGKHILKMVDLSEEKDVAEMKKIVATPAIISSLPPPFTSFIGDLSDAEAFRLAIESAV
jgi:circadian clock protein KaiB